MCKSFKGVLAAAALAAGLAIGPAGADSFTIRAAAGHPNPDTPGYFVTEFASFFEPEVQKRVRERTGHEIEFINGFGGSIVKVSEVFEGVESGLVDIGVMGFSFEPSKLFLHNFQMFLPFGPQDSALSLAAARRTYDRQSWLGEAFAQYNQELLGLAAIDGYHLGTRNAWDKLEDLKGVRLAGAGPNLKWLDFVGAIPVQSNMAEAYQAISTGMYDGWIMVPSVYYGFKLHEKAPNFTLVGFGSVTMHGVVMNSDALARLPEEVRAILREVAGEYEVRTGQMLVQTEKTFLDKMAAEGSTITEVPPTVRQEWAQSLKDWPNLQAQEANSRGMPGTAVLRSAIEESEAVGHVWPVRYVIED